MSYARLFDLSGKVAVVTGGAGILGAHFCEGLAAFGAHVVVVDREKAKAEALAAQLPGKARAIAIDITEEDQVAAMVKEVHKTYGRIDILHNNAATKPKQLERFFDPVKDFDMKVWDEVMRVNLNAMFLVARHVGEYMVEQGRGSIIQTASIYGVVAPDQRIYAGSEYEGHEINTPAVYSASKAGVIGLTKYLAAYWADKGVRVNALTPGGVESGQNAAFKKNYSTRVPMGRMGKAEEMVGALIFLASDASSYLTGQNLIVDGGLTAW